MIRGCGHSTMGVGRHGVWADSADWATNYYSSSHYIHGCREMGRAGAESMSLMYVFRSIESHDNLLSWNHWQSFQTCVFGSPNSAFLNPINILYTELAIILKWAWCV